MNDEIKEILNNLKNKDNDIKGINFLKYQDLTRGEIDLLLDYITNLEDYKSRCEKAIEYIKNDWYELNTLDIEHCVNLGKDIRIDLLNILQNGSDSQ